MVGAGGEGWSELARVNSARTGEVAWVLVGSGWEGWSEVDRRGGLEGPLVVVGGGGRRGTGWWSEVAEQIGRAHV